MSLILELDPATEEKLKSAASKSSTSSTAFVMDALKDRLSHSERPKSLKRQSIAKLLEEINHGMSEKEWTRYAALVSKRRKGNLSPVELAELLETSDRLERINARRINLVAELARRRGTTLEAELKKLGIGPRHV